MAGEWAESQISLDIPEDEPISPPNTKSEERASLLPGDNSSADQKGSSASLLSFQFYQNLFDVDTDTVLNRIRTAAIPKKNYSFIESVLRARRRSGPDMYGPFWICVTLVFSTAICGNLSHFLALRGNPDYDYSPQFDKVSLAATTIFGYAWILPFMIYMFMNYKTSGDYQFLEIVCTYGYSLFIYVPISFFWVFPMEGFRWFLLLAGAFVSGSMLAQALWPAVRSEKKQLVYALLGLVVVSNLALAIGFKVYFFNAPVKLDTAAALTSDINPLDDTHQMVPKDIIQPVEGAAVNQSVG